jgi:6-phosphogluconolactonase (cycloisomerase 2 family)
VAAVNTDCQQVDYSLHPVPGSPYAVSPGDNLGPITVDAYGSYLYVVATGSNLIAGFKINSSNGALSALSPTTAAAGQQPNAIAVRSDDSFVFVTNGGSPSTLSEYAIIPATGALSPESTIGISTFDLPTGVAVK